MARLRTTRRQAFYGRALSRLQDQGLKLTPQRDAILESFDGRGHWTPQELYATLQESVPSLSQATVYNTLELLEDLGVVKRIYAEDGQTYFDRNVDPHHHAICVECGVIVDIDVHDAALERLAASSRGCSSFDRCFEIEVAAVWFRGVCTACRV